MDRPPLEGGRQKRRKRGCFDFTRSSVIVLVKKAEIEQGTGGIRRVSDPPVGRGYV